MEVKPLKICAPIFVLLITSFIFLTLISHTYHSNTLNPVIDKKPYSTNAIGSIHPRPFTQKVGQKDNPIFTELCPASSAGTMLYIPIAKSFQDSGYSFTFSADKLIVETRSLVLGIGGGAIIYLKDKNSDETLVDTLPFQNWPNDTQDFVGFISSDKSGNRYLRRPAPFSSVTFTRSKPNKGQLRYSQLSDGFDPTNSQLLIEITVDEISGEVLLQLTGQESDTNLTPISINIPVADIKMPAVILGSGAKYTRNDPKVVDRSSYQEMGLNAPSVIVVEGYKSSFAAWSESNAFAPEYVILDHSNQSDQIILHAEQDLEEKETQRIVSPPWRVGTYLSWVEAARSWREKFERRSGAKPLSENHTVWVQQIHAVFDATNQLYTTREKFEKLASICTPSKMLYFIWNADRIVLYGDHTLVDKITRPTSEELSIIQQFGWHLLLFHPYNLIYSETGAANRLDYLNKQNWLPKYYQFHPDYESTPENWQTYWADVKAPYFDGSIFYLIHPGSTKFKNYLVHNLLSYSQKHSADGAYLDISGDDNSFLFPPNKKLVDNQDYVTGEKLVLGLIAQEAPNLAVMSEYQPLWVVPYVFYSWEGSVTHLKGMPLVRTRINHPLRTALIGSYSWTRESNSEYIDDVTAALMGTLPQISLEGDYGVSLQRAVWSQARAKLFCEEELFNDIPPYWESDALAYYRSKNNHWFKFSLIGSSYGYIEILPDGQKVIRLLK